MWSLLSMDEDYIPCFEDPFIVPELGNKAIVWIYNAPSPLHIRKGILEGHAVLFHRKSCHLLNSQDRAYINGDTQQSGEYQHLPKQDSLYPPIYTPISNYRNCTTPIRFLKLSYIVGMRFGDFFI